jgi:hypothetical protein
MIMTDKQLQKSNILLSSAPPLKYLKLSAFMALISALSAAIGSFSTTYISEKAKFSAIESSLEVIINQTSATESVKTKFDHGNWRNKELELLKRKKIDEYYSALLSFGNAIIYREDSETLDLKHLETSIMIQHLYLPELTKEHRNILTNSTRYMKWIAEDFLISNSDATSSKKILHKNEGNKLQDNLLNSITTSRHSIADIAHKINIKNDKTDI